MAFNLSSWNIFIDGFGQLNDSDRANTWAKSVFFGGGGSLGFSFDGRLSLGYRYTGASMISTDKTASANFDSHGMFVEYRYPILNLPISVKAAAVVGFANYNGQKITDPFFNEGYEFYYSGADVGIEAGIQYDFHPNFSLYLTGGFHFAAVDGEIDTMGAPVDPNPFNDLKNHTLGGYVNLGIRVYFMPSKRVEEEYL